MGHGPTEDLHKMVAMALNSWLAVFSHPFSRLNTKIEARNLEVKDLVKDLSDGVGLRYG
jgi:hypothetical protein